MRLLPPGSSRIQSMLASLGPALTISFLVTLFTMSLAHSIIREETLRFSNALADQVAITSAEYLINSDALSLNIMLRRLCLESDFEGAKIYNKEANVIAQAGESKDSDLKISRDIIFQNSVIGQLKIGVNVNNSFAFELLVKTLLTFLVLSSFFGIMFWSGTIVKNNFWNKFRKINSHAGVAQQEICYLVIKLNNLERNNKYREIFLQLCDFHSGEQQPHDKDSVISFCYGDHVDNGIIFGLKVKALNKLLQGDTAFEAGLDVGEDSEATLKHASYLAGISQNQLLVSHRAKCNCKALGNKSFQLKTINHNLIEEGKVFIAEEIENIIIEKTLKILKL